MDKDNDPNGSVNNEKNDHGEGSQITQQPVDQDRIDAYALSQLKTSQTLLTIAVIAGPVSLMLGGVLLSTIALICALVGYVKIKKVMTLQTSSKAISDNLRRQALICIVVCSAVLVINAAFFIQMVSMYMDYIANGDLQGLMDAMYGQSSSAASSSSENATTTVPGGSSSGESSIWDK